MKELKLVRRKTLIWKLVQVFLIMSLAGAVLHFFGTLISYQLFFDKLEQTLSWSLAEEYRNELQPLVSVKFDREAVEQKVLEFEQQNPRIDIYLLDTDGDILYSSETYVFSPVPLDSIRKFLEMEGYPFLPVYGVNPDVFRRDTWVPISVAPITIERRAGYVYVSLRGIRYHRVLWALGDFSLFSASAAFLILLVASTTILGLLLSRFFTKRFQALTVTLGRFAGGDLSARADDASEDEIGIHARVFNDMADTIQGNIRALEEKDKQRRDLIANVSHDLRTPLGAMQSLLEALSENYGTMDQDEQKVFLERTLINCRDLNALADDLFELSKLSAKTEEPVLMSVDLRRVLLSVVKKSVGRAEPKDLALVLDVPRELPRILADEHMLNRVVSNLVENAIRYSDRGGEIRLSAEKCGEGEVRVSISDKGIGIPEDELPWVFDRFYRGSQALDKERSGSGLGLAITKRIIELHGQRIWVESKVGSGSTFTFTMEAKT